MLASIPFTLDAAGERSAHALYRLHEHEVCRRTDRLFACLLLAQWLLGILLAIWVSPLTWAGTESQTHPHIWTAVFLGALINGLPIAFALTIPGEWLTRQVIAIAQAL